MNGNDTFLDVNDAHLRVTSGNVYASAFNLDQIDIVMSSNTASTVNFNNPTKAFNAASNIEVGTANLFVDTTTSNVGIGTNTPAYTLDVHGSANVGVITATDINVTGNLAVLGTSTIVDTDNLRVKDPIIELGKDNTASPVVDLGLVMTRPSGSSNVGIIFDESTDTLEIGYTQGNASDSTITMDSTPLSVNVNGDLSVTSNLEVGTANLFVDTVNSRVGIGTTSPDNALHIRGAIPAVLLDDSNDDTKVRITGGAGGDLYVDSNWGGSGNTGDIIFREASSEKMRIAGNGNVGITPRPPKARLQVGNLLTTSYSDRETIPQSNMGINTDFPSTTHAWFANRTSDSQEDYWGLAIGTKYSGDSYIQTVHKTTTIVFDLLLQPNGGNVGIGTTSPAKKLHVEHYGSAIGDFEGIRIANHATNLHATSRPAYEFVVSDIVAGTGIGASKFAIGYRDTTSASRTDRLVIDASGNVGIGTTSPSSVFNTFGGALWDGSSMASKVCATLEVGRGGGIGAAANDTGFGGILEFRHDSDSRFVTIESVSEAAYSASIGLRFKTHGGTGDGERMRIDGAGNVGIGTGTPRTNLHIGQQLNSQGDKNTIPAAGLGISADFPSSTHAWFAHRVNATGDEYWGLAVGTIYDGASYLQNLNKNSGTYYDLLLQPNGGNVGIGTGTPDSSLEVHGTGIHIDGTVLRSYSGIGAMTAGTWYKVCDFSALPATVSGVCAIRIKWGGGTLTNVGTYYWTGYASGIVPYNTYGDGNGTYSAAPSEPLTLTQHYHHRAAGAFEFILDGDGSGGSYGRQSIYIKTPQSLSGLSLEVIAMPLRR